MRRRGRCQLRTGYDFCHKRRQLCWTLPTQGPMLASQASSSLVVPIVKNYSFRVSWLYDPCWRERCEQKRNHWRFCGIFRRWNDGSSTSLDEFWSLLLYQHAFQRYPKWPCQQLLICLVHGPVRRATLQGAWATLHVHQTSPVERMIRCHCQTLHLHNRHSSQSRMSRQSSSFHAWQSF